MTTHYKTEGFIFAKSDLNESDRSFSVFTKDFGRLDIFAKAIRKSVSKLQSAIDIFFMSDIEFIQGKNRKTLIDATVVERFTSLPANLEKFRIANEISQLLDDFLKGPERDEKIFGLLEESFEKLNNLQIENSLKIENWKLKIVFFYFFWNFLALLGYKPEVDKCASCHEKLTPYGIYFSERSGGVICKKCLSQDLAASKINSDVVKILRLIFKKDWQIISRLKIRPDSQNLFQNISNSYRSYILSTNSFSLPKP